MTVLAILFIASLLQPTSPNRCARLYERTEMLRQQMTEEIQTRGQPTDSTLEQSAEYSRRARQCYGTHRSDTVATLYQRELYALRRLRRSDEALTVSEAFLEQFEGTGRPGQVAYVQQWRGRLYIARSKFKQALDAYTKALVSTRKADQPAWKKAELYLDVARVYRQLYDFEAAQRYAQQAEDVLRETSLSKRRNAYTLARVLRYQANMTILRAELEYPGPHSLAWGREKAHQSAKLYLRSQLPQSAGIAYIKVAETYAYADRPDEAMPYMQKAMRLGEETGNLALRSAATYKMGRLRLQREEYGRAERLLDRALMLAEQRSDLDYQRRISIDRGLLHETQQQWDEALRWYRRAAGLTERYRASLGVTEWASQATGNWYWQQPYRGQTRVLIEQGKPRAAFRILERSRSRYLRSLRRRARTTQTLPPDRRARFNSLRRALAATRDSLERAPTSAATRPALQAREVRLMSTLNEMLELPPDTSRFSIAATREALAPRQRVLLSYYLDEGSGLFERPTNSHVFVLTADTLHTISLNAPADTVRALQERASPVLIGTAPRSQNDVQFNLNGLHQLHQALFAPVDALVPEGAPLVVIPDGPLYGLPFGSLVTRETPPFDYDNAPYLLRNHPITTEGSATLLTTTEADGRKARYDVVAFGKSKFSAEGRSIFREADNRSLQMGNLADLPAVPLELDALRTLFANVFTALGEDATETAFYEHMSEGRILHLASHAVMHPTAPLYNAIVLSEEEERREDGILHLYELQRRPLETPLVVLSGCNTARGPLRSGEGMAGLQYGFRAMGAESLLATLWLVEDDATARLMRDFYHHLREGQAKDEALQQAQLAYLRETEAERASPFFWAAPMLYGQAHSLALEPRRGGFFGKWMILGLLLFLALSFFWWWRRKRFSA